jgi:hypothetical protein
MKSLTIEELRLVNNGLFKKKIICSICEKTINPLIEEVTFDLYSSKQINPLCAECKKELFQALIERGVK